MRRRCWCFTLNNPGDVVPQENDCVRYCIFGREVGEEGTPHLQGYVECNRAVTLGHMQKWLPRAHFEPRRGSQDQAIEYCKKENDFIEFGCKNQQGKRNDLESYRDAIREGKTDNELIEEFTTTDAVFHKWGARVRLAHIEHENSTIKLDKNVTVLWGDPGVGKTRFVYDTHGIDEVYCLEHGTGNALWFDGYRGQKVLLLDDFYGWLKPDMLLRLLDIYPCRVQVKGGSTTVNFEQIYITSNCPPTDWYAGVPEKVRNAISRRLHTVTHLSALGEALPSEEDNIIRDVDAGSDIN